MRSRVGEWDRGVGRRSFGDGSSVYVIRWRDGAGVQRTETLPKGTRRDEARRERAKRIAASDRGITAAGVTYSAFVPVWRESFELRHRAATIRAYEGALRNHLLPTFGSQRLRDLSLPSVQRWVDLGSGRSLSLPTLRIALAAHRSVMGAAARLGLVAPLDLRQLELPPAPVVDEPLALSMVELEALSLAAGEWWGPDLIFLGTTGLRRGEYAGLADDAVDLPARVCRVVAQLDERGRLEAPKSRAGIRDVQLVAHAVTAVQAKRALKLELGLRGCGIMFPTPRGRRVQWDTFYDAVWRPAIARAGLDSSLTLHNLRHTAASLLIAAGVDAGFVQKQLGHEKVTTTLDVYSHWFESRSPLMVERFDNAYGAGQ